MGRIVGIHGIDQQYRGGNELRAIWLPALKDGLIEAGRRDLSESIGEQDLRVSFFGSLFRPPGGLGMDFPPVSPEDMTSDDEVALVGELYNQAVALEPDLGPPSGALGPARVAVQVMAERLLRCRTFADLTERAFLGSLKQVNQFLDDPDIKEKVLARVAPEIDDSTRILIGHSLGSVVAYEYLCRYQPPGIELLVTLGSPLGIPNVIFERLTPAPGPGGGVWPGAVKSWVNVADADDVVALRKQLTDLFPPPPGIDPIVDKPVDNGKSPHKIDPYLNCEATGAAIAAAL
jgi:hypothetical protein